MPATSHSEEPGEPAAAPAAAPSPSVGGRGYQRSVSVGTSPGPGWDGRVMLVRRRRAPSSGERSAEAATGAGSAAGFLGRPSSRLQQLRAALSLGAGQAEPQALLARPVVAFVLQQHELSCLRRALRRAIRRAACRVYALQVSTALADWALPPERSLGRHVLEQSQSYRLATLYLHLWNE